MSGFDYTYFRSNKTRLNIKNLSDFIKHCSEKHNNKYDYSGSIYNGNQKKILIICPEHGEFHQKAQSHIAGSGCPNCGKIKMVRKRVGNEEDFARKAGFIHKWKYTYEDSGYIGLNHSVDITCKNHGKFSQSAMSHLAGIGCPSCTREKRESGVISGWSRSSFTDLCNNSNNGMAVVYLIRCFSGREYFFKIGISSRTVKGRFASFKSMPYAYEVIKTHTMQGGDAWDAEKLIHRRLKNFKYKPSVYFGGETECFAGSIDFIVSEFNDAINTKKSDIINFIDKGMI